MGRLGMTTGKRGCSRRAAPGRCMGGPLLRAFRDYKRLFKGFQG